MFKVFRIEARSEAASTARLTPVPPGAAGPPSAAARAGWRALLAVAAVLAAVGSTAAKGENARFDLVGPKVEVRVTRGRVTLPIASVPNLQPGDRLWLHPNLPPTQSVHYLMVLVFLRGTTNPPPDNWFIRIETWSRRVRAEGVEVTVPDEAQEAVLFLAPVTGGDFSTLRSAVEGRPGVFVRASQDLEAAGFEQARIEKYIDSMKQLSPEQTADPKQLQEHSNLLAATLALKPNGDCMKLPPDQEYTCLTQSGGQTLLDDGHGQSIVDALTGNTSAGLIGTVSNTRLAGGGVYSAYVGSIVDLVHIMGSLHTAQYQYIPAIAFPQQQSLNLRLNTPPSFHNPKSVIVIGLPSIQQSTPPPLRATDPKEVSCLLKPSVVLPVEGAPLVFSTQFAHDLVLHLNDPHDAMGKGNASGKENASGKDGAGGKGSVGGKDIDAQDIPLSPDAFRGGLVLRTLPKRYALSMPPDPGDTHAGPATAAPQGGPQPDSPDAPPADVLASAQLTGTVKGYWGFDPFTGPTLPLEETPGKDWRLAGDDPVIAGKNQHVILSSTGTACVDSIALEPVPPGQDKLPSKPADKPNQIDVTLDVPAHDAGAMHLAIQQFGDAKPATVSLVSYSPPAKLDALRYHAGDKIALLTGTSLTQVRQVDLGGVMFEPAAEGTNPIPQPDGKSELRLMLGADAKTPSLPVGDNLTAQISLHDGRTLHLPVTVETARPVVSLISKADVPPASPPRAAFRIHMASENDLPTSDGLIFSLKSASPFPRAGKVEIASPDDSLHAMLSLTDSSPALILETPDTLLATLEPLKIFGPSAFGPVRARALAPDGTAGDWMPLVTLVRLPSITELSCPVTPSASRPKPAPAKAATAGASPVGGSDPAGATDSAPHSANTAPAAIAAAPDSASATAASSQKTDSSAPPAATAAPPLSCTLYGSGLYFVDSLAADEAFTNPVRVPEGFVGSSIAVPPPTGAVYYLRLRDDPATADMVTLPAGPL